MPAGLNIQLEVIRITDQADDSIGGAQPSGTVVYPRVYGRIMSKKPTQAILEQGLVTPTIFTIAVTPNSLVINFNDQVQITWPQYHPLYNHRLVVIGVQDSSMTDVRAFKVLTVRRIEQANMNLLQ